VARRAVLLDHRRLRLVRGCVRRVRDGHCGLARGAAWLRPVLAPPASVAGSCCVAAGAVLRDRAASQSSTQRPPARPDRCSVSSSSPKRVLRPARIIRGNSYRICPSLSRVNYRNHSSWQSISSAMNWSASVAGRSTCKTVVPAITQLLPGRQIVIAVGRARVASSAGAPASRGSSASYRHRPSRAPRRDSCSPASGLARIEWISEPRPPRSCQPFSTA
jgi:hypothetical protein